MNCAEVKYYLNDYSKGILLDEVRAEIHEHLNCCKSCTKVLDNMISISNAASAKKKIVRQNKRIWERVHKEREKNNRTQKIVPRIFPASSRISSEAHHLKSSLMLKANEIENNKLLVIAGIISVIALGRYMCNIIKNYIFKNSIVPKLLKNYHIHTRRSISNPCWYDSCSPYLRRSGISNFFKFVNDFFL